MARSNIVLITADGLHGPALGCAGNPDVRTPNIDALAAHGLRFSNAMSGYAALPAGGHAPLRGATPAAFMPGQGTDESPEGPLLLPQTLAGAGYTTGAIGTLDVKHADLLGPFQRISATGNGAPEDAYAAWLAEEGKPPPSECIRPYPPDADPARFLLPESFHPTSWTGSQAVRYCQTATEPFFLWVSFPSPRWPLTTPAVWKQLYRPGRLTLPPWYGPPEPSARDTADPVPGEKLLSPSRMRKMLVAYYGAVSHVDRQVGRIMATLTGRGRTNNVIVFTAGHGVFQEQRGPLAGNRGALCDTVAHIPLIVGGMLGQRKGKVDPGMVTLGDVAPTLLDGLSIPAPGWPEGRSFLARLRRAGAPHRKAVVLQGVAGQRAVRSDRYLWVSSPAGDQLYNLQADPFALQNLHGTRPSLAIEKMLASLV